MVLGGVVGFSGLSSLLVVGCVGDDTVVPVPDGGGIDAKGDGTTTVDTGTDALPDTNPGFDAGDAGLFNYSHLISQALCARLAYCCQGADAAAFDLAGCTAATEVDPQASPGIGDQNALAYLDGGHIFFDKTKASQCFADIAALSCGAILGSDAIKLRTDCLAGAVGTIPAGTSGCRGSAECVPPAHCEIGADGGVGVCTAPRAAGAACGATLPNESQAQCGYLLLGTPNYCQTPNDFGVLADGGGATNKCTPPQPLDAGCFAHLECASGFCSAATVDPALVAIGAGACGTSIVLADQPTCDSYVIVDAGGQ